VDIGVVLGVLVALAFAVMNGVNDAAAVVAMPVVTRVARPSAAIALAVAGNLLGPLMLGTAVAGTIAGIVAVQGPEGVAIVGAGLTGAVSWCAFCWWRGIPASASQALVGGLTGAALAAGGPDAVNWGGVSDWRPSGVLGALVALVVSVVLGLVLGAVADLLARVALRRATRRVEPAVGAGEWLSAGALAFGHGANDAQKSMGAIAAVLVASGHQTAFTVPLWVTLAAAAALTFGTALGGWSIVRTLGKRIVRIRPLDGLVSQGSSAFVVVASSLVGAPVSTTEVLSSSIVGAGVGRRRGRHVRWSMVSHIGVSWLTTIPAAGLLGAVLLPVWRMWS
jgi:PiT family inorganic phosphate transporter